MTDALTRGARGGGVTIIGQALKLVLNFVSVVVLSRLLGPEDFGLVAMVAVFIALGELIRDFGTGIVGLQRRALSHQQASNLFWLNSALGLTAAVLLALSTPLLVLLYDEQRLTAIVPALAVGIVLNAMSSQLQVQLARSMRYVRVVAADVTSSALALAVAITVALAGGGYWALIAQALATAASGLALRWSLSGWRPLWPRRSTENRSMVADSAAFGFAQFLSYLSANLDSVAIGIRWDAPSLGGYSRAYQLLQTPIGAMMAPLTQVVVPTVNRAREEGQSIDSVLLRIQFGLGFVVVWVYVITAAIAHWLIPTLLGSQWAASVLTFQILAVGGAVWVFSFVSYWAFIVDNLGRSLFVYNLVVKSLASLLIFGASFISIHAIAWAVSIGLVLSWPINLVWLAKAAGHNSWAYFWSGFQLLYAGALAFLVSWGFATQFSAHAGWAVSMLAVMLGSCVYIGSIAALPAGRRELRGALAMITRAIRQESRG